MYPKRTYRHGGHIISVDKYRTHVTYFKEWLANSTISFLQMLSRVRPSLVRHLTTSRLKDHRISHEADCGMFHISTRTVAPMAFLSKVDFSNPYSTLFGRERCLKRTVQPSGRRRAECASHEAMFRNYKLFHDSRYMGARNAPGGARTLSRKVYSCLLHVSGRRIKRSNAYRTLRAGRPRDRIILYRSRESPSVSYGKTAAESCRLDAF